jgi:hypothetical protein
MGGRWFTLSESLIIAIMPASALPRRGYFPAPSGKLWLYKFPFFSFLVYRHDSF